MARSRSVVALALILGVGCSSPPFIELPNPIAGRITEVKIETFVITTDAGQRYEFINPHDEESPMGQPHMRIHQADRSPVLITWRRDGYQLVATRIEDAPGAPASSPLPSLPPGFPGQ